MLVRRLARREEAARVRAVVDADGVRALQAGVEAVEVDRDVVAYCVDLAADGRVSSVTPLHRMPLWENGGFFVLRPEIFDYLPEGGDLMDDACAALAKEGRLLAHRHRGFWAPADTNKERSALERAYLAGDRPWALWEDD